MKKTIAAFLAAILAFSLAACGGQNPEELVRGMLEAVKTGEKDKIMPYINYNLLTNSTGTYGPADSDQYKRIFENIQYEIGAVEEGDKESFATVKITNIDMRNVYFTFLEQALSYIQENPPLDDGTDITKAVQDTIKSIFTQNIEDNRDKTANFECTVKLELADKKWHIILDAELKDALTGGLSSAIAQASKDAAKAEAERSKLFEIRNFMAGQLWNAGFREIGWYAAEGTNANGEEMDLDAVLAGLDKNMEKKAEYAAYINELDDVKYSDVKTTFTTLSQEVDKLYALLQQERPTPKDPNSPFDTNDMQKYSQAFTQAVDALQ